MAKKFRKPTFLGWIGLGTQPDFTRAPVLGLLVGVLLLLVAIAVAVGGIATILQFSAVVLSSEADDEAIRNLGLIVVAVLGAPFVIWRAMVAQKQADTAEQSHITDQINRAVAGLGTERVSNRIGRPLKIFMGKASKTTHLIDNIARFSLPPKTIELRRYHDQTLVDPETNEVFSGWHVEVKTWKQERNEIEWQGSTLAIDDEEAIAEIGEWSVFSESLPNIEVRVGAIYALERISEDSLRDHIQIMEILTAYIRENAPVEHLNPSEELSKPPRPRTDVQAALDVLGRRDRARIEQEHRESYRLDLRETDLSGANFSNGNFDGAILFNCRLEACFFRSTSLRGVRMNHSLLNFCDFFGSDLCGAILDGAVLNATGFWNGSVSMAAKMQGISLAAADISAINHLPTEPSHSPTFGTSDTRLADHLATTRDELSRDIESFMYAAHGLEVEDEAGVRQRLSEAGFLYWSPFPITDGFTNVARRKLLDDLGLKGFPYTT